MKYCIILASLILSISQVMAVSYDEYIDNAHTIENECKAMHKKCEVLLFKFDKIQAYTLDDNTILISTHAVKTLDKYELLAVLLHELGHIKHQDVFWIELRSKFIKSTPYNKELRYKIEYRADKYAVNYFGNRCMPNYMIQALSKSSKVNSPGSLTHPAIKDRIKNAEKIYVNKCNK